VLASCFTLLPGRGLTARCSLQHNLKVRVQFAHIVDERGKDQPVQPGAWLLAGQPGHPQGHIHTGQRMIVQALAACGFSQRVLYLATNVDMFHQPPVHVKTGPGHPVQEHRPDDPVTLHFQSLPVVDHFFPIKGGHTFQ
jgi:hypothetical protein